MRLWISFGVYHPSVNHFIVFFFLALPQNIMFSVIDDVPEMVDCFWEPPPPVQKNGIITRYSIVCIHTGGVQPVNFIIMTNDVMSGTLNATGGGFISATQYNYIITASTNAGPEPAGTRNVLTCKCLSHFSVVAVQHRILCECSNDL